MMLLSKDEGKLGHSEFGICRSKCLVSDGWCQHTVYMHINEARKNCELSRVNNFSFHPIQAVVFIGEHLNINDESRLFGNSDDMLVQQLKGIRIEQFPCKYLGSYVRFVAARCAVHNGQ